MKARLLVVLAVIGLVLTLGVARAATNGCNPGVDLFGCLVSGSGPIGLRVENTRGSDRDTAIFGYASAAGSTAGATTGVQGQTDALVGNGVQGLASASSGSASGVRGQSNAPSGIGVIGVASASSGNTTGVTGRVSSPSGIGVDGLSNGGIGVAARSVSGTGLRAESSTGFAVQAAGNTTQSRTKGGWVKALLRMAGGTLSRCYNSQAAAPTTAETCDGFSIAGGAGNYTITFPFQVNDRYVTVTTESVAASPRCCLVQYDFPTTNQIRVRTWDDNGAAIDRAFSLVVF